MLARNFFENMDNNSKSVTSKNSLEKQISMIELHTKICADSCSIADYRDYEKILLELLLKKIHF